jgi:hypothetical protein
LCEEFTVGYYSYPQGCKDGAKRGFDAGIQAYKEMLEGVGVEGARQFWISELPKDYGNQVYCFERKINDYTHVIEALPVLAKLQQQSEKIEQITKMHEQICEVAAERFKKITELESRLKEAESVIKRLSECHLPSKPCAGSDLAQVMLEENCGIARQYMEKVK